MKRKMKRKHVSFGVGGAAALSSFRISPSEARRRGPKRPLGDNWTTSRNT